MSETTEKTVPTTPNPVPNYTSVQDAYKAGVEATSRTIKLYKLFEQYAGDFSERDQRAFAGLLKERYERAVASGETIDDEKFFQEVRALLEPEKPEEKKEVRSEEVRSGKEEKEETKKEEKVSPKGTTETTKGSRQVEITPLEASEYILGDDEKYFEARENYYNKLRSYKPTLPDHLIKS